MGEITDLAGVVIKKNGTTIMSSPSIVNFTEGNYDILENPTGTLEARIQKPFDPTTDSEIFDDFISFNSGITKFGELQWVFAYAGAVGSITQNAYAIDVNHPGTVRLNAGSGLNADAKITGRTTDSSITYGILGNTPNMRFVCGVASPSASLSSKLQIIGYAESIITPAVGIYFQATDTGNWQAVTNDGTATTSDTGVAQATTFKRFEYLINAAGTSVAFYIDGVLVATHTTNIPTTGLKPIFYIKTTEGVAKSLDMDYFYTKISLLNR